MSAEQARPHLPLPEVQALAAPEELPARLAELGVSLTPAQITKLGTYLALLLAMNEQMNLTAVTDPVEAWSRHVLDGLSIVPELTDLPAGARVIDVGSGGGVPGIPLAIARPDLEIVLLDATEKKVAFLAGAASALELANLKCVWGRAEELAQGKLGRAFEAVTARAVAKLSTLLGWTAPFARPGGRLVYIKGAKADEELRDAKKQLRAFRCEHQRTVLRPTGRVVVLSVR